MTTSPAATGPADQAQAEEAQTDQGLKLKWFLPAGAVISLIALVVEIFTTANSNPPIGQMGWAIMTVVFVSFCARHAYRLQKNLICGSELEPTRTKEILDNQLILLGIVSVATLALGVFLGSAF